MNFFKKYNPAFNGEISPGIKFNFDFLLLKLFNIPCPTALPAPVIIILIFFSYSFLKNYLSFQLLEWYEHLNQLRLNNYFLNTVQLTLIHWGDIQYLFQKLFFH